MSAPPLTSVDLSFPGFPLEIIDLFVGNLTDTDSEMSLLDCSLVSSTFRDAAQKRLFSTTSIDNHQRRLGTSIFERRTQLEMYRRIRGLEDLLQSRGSNLGKHIRKLELSVNDENFLIIFHLNDLLELITSRATNLRTLQIAGIGWDHIHPKLVRSLTTLLQCPSPIQNLEILQVSKLPWNLIADCPSLRTLHFRYDVKFIPSPGNPDEAAHTKICDYLRLDGEYRFIPNHSATFMDISQLEHFKVAVSNQEDMQKFEKLTEGAFNLVSFDLEFAKEDSVEIPNSINLGSLHSLTNVCLRLPWMLKTLDIAKFLSNGMPTNLEIIEIIFTTDDVYYRLINSIRPYNENKFRNIGPSLSRTNHPRLITAKLMLHLTHFAKLSKPPPSIKRIQEIEEDFPKQMGCHGSVVDNSDLLEPIINVQVIHLP